MTELPEVEIFTDGASSPDGRGGWAYVVVKDGIEIRREQGCALGVTHQRMEIRAVGGADIRVMLQAEGNSG